MADERSDSASPLGNLMPPTPGASQYRFRPWAWLPWSLVAILAATTIWLAFKGSPRPSEQPTPLHPGEQTSPSDPAVATPRRVGLEEWPDGKAAVELVGYKNVYAYRWSGGVLSGWVEFDDGTKPRREAIDLNESIAKHNPADPRGFSGQVVIARRQPADAKGGQECWVWVRVEREIVAGGEKYRESRSQIYHGPWRARGESEGVVGSGDHLTFHSGASEMPFYGNVATTWLELRVNATAMKE